MIQVPAIVFYVIIVATQSLHLYIAMAAKTTLLNFTSYTAQCF
jgi:hypothetical protein